MSNLRYQCTTCLIQCANETNYRSHHKTDWHVFNLKRKVVDLAPLDAEEFQAAVMRVRNLSCEICRKSFNSEGAHAEHMKSRLHRRNLKAVKGKKPQASEVPEENEDDLYLEEDIEELDSDEWEETDTDNASKDNDCCFCGHHSASMTKNLKHMASAHSFFVPDAEYCVDLKGLLNYLAVKVNTYYMCLWCNEKGKSFYTADAARQHMLDKGHTKMLYEGVTLAEYVDYYDYSASYPDAEQADVNGEVEEVPEIDGSDYQLVLPSGAVIGHRSLMRYYRQNIDPNRQVVPVGNSKKLHKVLAHYKALGWNTTQQDIASKRARDLHVMKREYARLKLAVKANKFQKHYRAQVMF